MPTMILMVYVVVTGGAGGVAVSMQEFTSPVHCEIARQWVLKAHKPEWGVTADCLAK